MNPLKRFQEERWPQDVDPFASKILTESCLAIPHNYSEMFGGCSGTSEYLLYLPYVLRDFSSRAVIHEREARSISDTLPTPAREKSRGTVLRGSAWPNKHGNAHGLLVWMVFHRATDFGVKAPPVTRSCFRLPHLDACCIPVRGSSPGVPQRLRESQSLQPARVSARGWTPGCWRRRRGSSFRPFMFAVWRPSQPTVEDEKGAHHARAR